MSKILKIIKILIEVLINLAIFVALAIILLWVFWDVTPQTSVTKTAYFFSESWRLISGHQKPEDEFKQVSEKQLQEPKKHINYIQQ